MAGQRRVAPLTLPRKRNNNNNKEKKDDVSNSNNKGGTTDGGASSSDNLLNESDGEDSDSDDKSESSEESPVTKSPTETPRGISKSYFDLDNRTRLAQAVTHQKPKYILFLINIF